MSVAEIKYNGGTINDLFSRGYSVMQWKLSSKWASHHLDCTLQGITRPGGCHAGCCTAASGNFWPARANPVPRPDQGCFYLGSAGCTLSLEDRPVTCLLYPLMINHNGTIIFHQRALFPHMPCGPNNGRGPMVIEALAVPLSSLLGREVYHSMLMAVQRGEDIVIDVPPEIAEILDIEHREAEQNLLPPLRRQRHQQIPEESPMQNDLTDQQVSEPIELTTDRAEMSYLDRTVRRDIVPAISLLANPKNWRIHPQLQRQGLDAVLTNIGWVQDVVVNIRMGEEWGASRGVETLVDGHLRVLLALSKGDDTVVPVKFVDLSPEEADIVLATLDPLSAIAVVDKTILAQLLQDVQVIDPSLETILENLAQSAGILGTVAGQVTKKQLDDASEAATTFGDYVDFQFGDYRGKVGRAVYNDFTEVYNRQKTAEGAVMLDDVLRSWLHV